MAHLGTGVSTPNFVVDWDGTCAEDSWPKMGKWLPGAVDALRALTKLGTVEIDSCRCNPYEHGFDGITLRPAHITADAILSIRSMLDAEGLHMVRIHTTTGKPSGVEYIDNKARRFTGRKKSWDVLVDLMQGLYGKGDQSTR